MANPNDPPALVSLTKRLEQTRALDAVVRAVHPGVHALLADQKRADALHGMWVGHAIHPVLTDVPIGFWTSAAVLDLVGGKKSRTAARRLTGLGVLAAVPTALTGWAEWGLLDQPEQRVGVVHAASNAGAVALFTGSWRARRKGRHARGVVLGLAGNLALQVGGYLGGHLTEVRKASSVHPAYDEPAPAPA